MRAEYREEPCRSALNPVRGMPFEWSLNPYMGCVHRCTFCYVRSFERRAERPSGEAYGRSIRVKVNVAEVLRRELARPRWTRATVAIGAATDPYQPAEGRYRLTRACIAELSDACNPFGILTRGPLVIRDIDLLQHAASRADVRVWLSVPTLDEALWRQTEPGTAPPAARLRAVRQLAEARVRVSVLMAPLIPGHSDAPESVERVVRAAREAGAAAVSPSLLYLQPGTREHFLEAIERSWPGEGERLAKLYAGRTYLPAPLQRHLSATAALARERWPRAAHLPPALRPAPAPEPEPPVLAHQLGLAL